MLAGYAAIAMLLGGLILARRMHEPLQAPPLASAIQRGRPPEELEACLRAVNWGLAP
jgi:hypothetical protein